MPEYRPSVTGNKFHECDTFVKAIMGPLGSGKSVTCCMEILIKAYAQEPSPDGVRRSRWVIIRNSYRELQDTTIRTFFDWIPSSLGTFKQVDMIWRLKEYMADGTVLDLEVLFRALDKPNDAKKLLSLELTGAFINEAREIPKQIFDMVQGRVGRYPKIADGGPTWYGVIMDTNPCDSDHWWYSYFEEAEENDVSKLFKQPSGNSEEAENIANLPVGYYERMSHGKDPEWIKVYVDGLYGFVTDGMPVVPEFHDHIHVAELPFEFESDILHVGVDFGRTPAAVFAQEINGQVQIIDELCTFGVSATHFSKLVADRIKGHYPKAEVIATGDPAGEHPGEQIDDTCIEIMQNAGIPMDPAYTNNFTVRRDSVAISLTQLTMLGEPQLVISPNCTMLRKGMNGGYRYKRMQVSGERFQQKPDKNKYSHVCEALQYLMLGLGRGYDVISSHSNVTKFKVVGALR